MSTATLVPARPGLLRHSAWDALLVALAFGHGALLLAVPAAPVVALGLWWNSNTVAHYFLHRPFFRPRPLNALFSLYLSVLLGVLLLFNTAVSTVILVTAVAIWAIVGGVGAIVGAFWLRSRQQHGARAAAGQPFAQA